MLIRMLVVTRLNNSVVAAGDLEVDLKLAMQGRRSYTHTPTVVLQLQHIPRPNLLYSMEWYDFGLIGPSQGMTVSPS
jgi:hypothetical protein